MSTNTKLAEALAQFEAALLSAYPEGARGAVFDCWNAARQALAAHDAEQAALRDLECPPDPEMVDRALAAADQKRAYALAARQQAQVPEDWKLAPHYRGYALLGTGKDGGLHMADSFEQHMIRRLAGVEAERDKLRAAREADAEAMRRAMLALQSLWLHGDAAAAIANPAIEDLRARLEAVAGWQPISTAPKDGSLFLCWVEAVQYGENDEGQQYQIDVSQVDFCQWQSHDDAPDGGWFEPCCGHISDHQRVTHWMPLPAAPQEPTHG